MSETTTSKYLDLSGEITDAEYRWVLNNLLGQFEQWRCQHGWCSEFWRPVLQLTRTFRWERSRGPEGGCWLDIPLDRDGAGRAADLREVRGRILRFTETSPDYLSLAQANEFLSNAGLAPYETNSEPQRRHYLSVVGYIDSDLTEEQIREKTRRWFSRMGASRAPTVNIEPASRSRTVVPRRDTVPLLTASER